jgi:ABC-2 type transport system permease protein
MRNTGPESIVPRASSGDSGGRLRRPAGVAGQVRGALRIFFVGGLISYRALFNFLNPWIFVPSLLVAPIFQILLFAYIGRSAGLESDKFYVIGNAVQYTAIPCLFAMTQTIAGERYQQTLGYLLVTPAWRLPLFLGRAVPVIANGFFVGVFALVVGGAILRIDVPSSAYAPLALVTAVAAYSCTGLGLINAALGLVIRETAVLSNVIFGLLLIFTGANVPMDDLPNWMQSVAQVLPFTHAIEAAREVADGVPFSEVSGLVVTEAAIGTVYVVVGYAMLRWIEVVSRRRATLERA